MTVRYVWWGAEDRARRVNKSICLLEKKYPESEVETGFQPYPYSWKKFNTRAPGGNPPDMFRNAIGPLRE